MSLLRRARKLLPHSRCGTWYEHKHHVWVEGRSDSPRRGETVYCNGIALAPETKLDKARRKLLRDLEPRR